MPALEVSPLLTHRLNQLDTYRLGTCHQHLVELFLDVSDRQSILIAEGHRGMTDQERAYTEGRSKVHYPNSKHNGLPSLAVDVWPRVWTGTGWDTPWSDRRPWLALAAEVMATAQRRGILTRWGGDWHGPEGGLSHPPDDLTAWVALWRRSSLVDLPHWELVTP